MHASLPWSYIGYSGGIAISRAFGGRVPSPPPHPQALAPQTYMVPSSVQQPFWDRYLRRLPAIAADGAPSDPIMEMPNLHKGAQKGKASACHSIPSRHLARRFPHLSHEGGPSVNPRRALARVSSLRSGLTEGPPSCWVVVTDGRGDARVAGVESLWLNVLSRAPVSSGPPLRSGSWKGTGSVN